MSEQSAEFNEQEMIKEHRRSWMSFEYMMLFAALHVALTLACVALAFLGGVRLLALLFWIAGTVGMITTFVVRWSSTKE